MPVVEPPRTDRYLHPRGAVELGIKVRGDGAGEGGGIDVKGRIAVLRGSPRGLPADAELWGKWTGPALPFADLVRVEKRRRLRRFVVARARAVEADDAGPVPTPGCTLELTSIRLPGHPREAWTTLAFEATGGLDLAPAALKAAWDLVGPAAPALDGLVIGYPAWLCGL